MIRIDHPSGSIRSRPPGLLCILSHFFVRWTKMDLVWSEIYTGLPQVWFWAAPEEPVPETVLCECKASCLFHYLLSFLICLWCNIKLPQTCLLCLKLCVHKTCISEQKWITLVHFSRWLTVKINWQTHIWDVNLSSFLALHVSTQQKTTALFASLPKLCWFSSF